MKSETVCPKYNCQQWLYFQFGTFVWYLLEPLICFIHTIWYKIKKGLIMTYPQLKIYIHLRCYIAELEIEAGIQKDSKWGISHTKQIESYNILTKIFSDFIHFSFYMVFLTQSNGMKWISLSFVEKGFLHCKKVTRIWLGKGCLMASIYNS